MVPSDPVLHCSCSCVGNDHHGWGWEPWWRFSSQPLLWAMPSSWCCNRAFQRSNPLYAIDLNTPCISLQLGLCLKKPKNQKLCIAGKVGLWPRNTNHPWNKRAKKLWQLAWNRGRENIGRRILVLWEVDYGYSADKKGSCLTLPKA